MAVRSKRLAGPTRLTSGAYIALYTVPAGETAIVKAVTAANEGGAVTVFLRINGTSGAGTLLTSFASPVGMGSGASVWWVLKPGDVLYAYGSGVGCDLSIHGAELEGVAD